MPGRPHFCPSYAITDCLKRVGLQLLGIPIDCHGFRHAIATALVERDPGESLERHAFWRMRVSR
jgi:hypothetical protein